MLKAILAGAASAMALTFAAPAFAEPPAETSETQTSTEDAMKMPPAQMPASLKEMREDLADKPGTETPSDLDDSKDEFRAVQAERLKEVLENSPAATGENSTAYENLVEDQTEGNDTLIEDDYGPEIVENAPQDGVELEP